METACQFGLSRVYDLDKWRWAGKSHALLILKGSLLGMEIAIAILLLGAYGFVSWRFWGGFNRTNFNKDFITRLSMSLLWPILVFANKSYRRNFGKALKGR